MKFGSANSNYRHGGYCYANNEIEIKASIARDLLRRVLTTSCDSRGELPFTKEEQAWALGITRRWMSGECRPDWCKSVMVECGFSEQESPIE